MSTNGFADGPVDDPWAQFRRELDVARAELERARSRPVLDDDQRDRLHQDALRGDLGPNMQELAERIESGRDSWDNVFAGESPHLELFYPHLNTMAAQNREVIRVAVEEDPDFDPFPPPENL